MRRASKIPRIPIAMLRSTFDEAPCDPRDPDEGPCVSNETLCVPEEKLNGQLDEDEDAAPDVVPMLLLLVCDVEEIVDEVSRGSRTSKLNHIKSNFSHFPKDDGDNLHEHIDDRKLGTGWDNYMNRMFLVHRTGPLSNCIGSYAWVSACKSRRRMVSISIKIG